MDHYTYSDYLKWDDDVRRELIDGVVYLMAGPNRKHQKILGNMYLIFGNFLKGKPCEVYLAPFDVRLNADTLDDTVVQPDIMIVCDHSIMTDAGIAGVPSLLVEILSTNTSSRASSSPSRFPPLLSLILIPLCSGGLWLAVIMIP